MFKRIQHISICLMLLFSATQTMAQIAMPDTVCIGTNRTYRVNDPSVPSTYTWKIDGVTQGSIKNDISIAWNTPGKFLLTVQEHANNGCDGDIRSGLIYVMPLPVANAGPDVIVCFGNTIRLNGSGGDLYRWSPSTYLSNAAIANPLVTIPAAGIYKYVLNVSNNSGCKSLKGDTVSVTILPPVKIFAGNDTIVTINQPVQLNAHDINNSGFLRYLWSPSFGLNNNSIKNPVALFNNVSSNNGITYIVKARTADGCEAKDDINIKVFLKPDLYVPTGFTPNGDGLNDFAVVIPAGIKELKYFSIYNRWGELVFTTKDYTKGWNGIYKGIPQDGNAFVWIAMGIDYNGNTISRKGTVTLIR
jgi:gliding motility-associated-like protein